VVKMDVVVVEEVDVGVLITTIFPRTYARMHSDYVHLRARVLTPEVKLVNTNEQDASAARQTVRDLPPVPPGVHHGVYFAKTQ
jgi:hypothetical protein